MPQISNSLKKDKKNSFLASPGNGSGRLRVRVPIEFVVDRFLSVSVSSDLTFDLLMAEALKPGCGLGPKFSHQKPM